MPIPNLLDQWRDLTAIAARGRYRHRDDGQAANGRRQFHVVRRAEPTNPFDSQALSSTDANSQGPGTQEFLEEASI